MKLKSENFSLSLGGNKEGNIFCMLQILLVKILLLHYKRIEISCIGDCNIELQESIRRLLADH